MFPLSSWYPWYQSVSLRVYCSGWGGGSFLTLDLIWILADIVNGLMAFPNLVALIGLRKEIISETKDYFERLKATQHDQDELA